MNIVLQKAPADNNGYFKRGAKLIMVDGVQWGSIYMEGHGCHGPSYHFRQEGGETITAPGSTRGTPLSVRGDRHARYSFPIPIEEKLLATVRELIEGGRLQHPDVVKRRIADANARYAKNAAEREAKQRADDLAKVHELLAQHAPSLNDRDALAAAIAELMAQIRD